MNHPIIENYRTVTVFSTVYNVAGYLPRFFQCMKQQTYKDFALLIIYDGSEDDTLSVCRSYAEEDSRIRIVHIDHVGISAARNVAISLIETPFAASADGDDVYEPDYLRHLVEAQEKYDADLVISRVAYRNEQYDKMEEFKKRGERFIPRGQFQEMLPVLLEDGRLNYLYAKLFRTEMLKTIHVDETVTQGSDTIICCQYVTKANSIVITDDLDTNYIKYSSRSVTSRHDRDEYQVLCRIQNTISEIFGHSGFLNEEMQRVIDGRVLQSALWVLSSVAKGDDPVNAALKRVNDIFRSPIYMEAYERQKTLGNLNTFLFQVIDPECIRIPESQITGLIIVSVTSYPARINSLADVLETVFNQTRKADKVILWLAENQFPAKEIPESLDHYVEEQKLSIRWCDDLMSHKKYFYAFREYPNDLVITIDDDLLYSPTLIEKLYQSYLLHPYAVSAFRTHLMLLENGEVLPYSEWIKEYSLHIGDESMLLFATSGAGTLFPTYLFNLSLLDEGAIRQNCLYSDDIWLKLMQIADNIPVVLAAEYKGLQILSGTQENSLYSSYNRDQNDEQLKKSMKWFDGQYNNNFIIDKLERSNDKLNGKMAIIEYYQGKAEEKNAVIRKQKREIAKLQYDLSEVWNSWSLRIGRVITWPGRTVRDHMRKKWPRPQ